MNKLTKNVYQHISHKHIEPWGMMGASGLVVVDGNDAYIVDTPWTLADTEQLLTWLKTQNLTLKAAVITHFHQDASNGIAMLNKLNINTYATPLTNSLLALKNRQQTTNIIPTTRYELLSDTIEVFYPGAGHSKDNIVVWLPKSNILFGGCFVKNLNSKGLGNTEDAVINAWPSSIDAVIKQYPDINIVVPGHGKIGDKNLLTHTKALALSVAN